MRYNKIYHNNTSELFLSTTGDIVLTFAVDISGIVSLYVYFVSPLFVPLVPITAVNFLMYCSK